MALILNLETATTVCSVALSENGKLLALKEMNAGYTHAENLTVFIQDVMQEAGKKMPDLEAVAVSKGPGSYTGLRIGVSTAKGICYGLNIPLIGTSTLKSLTQQALTTCRSPFSDHGSLLSALTSPRTAQLLCPMLDARRLEVYCALYNQELKEIEGIQAKIIDEHSFEETLKTHVIYFFGDGADKCRSMLGANPNAKFIKDVFPSASEMASFAEEAFKAGQFEDTAYFEPYYLKDFVGGPGKKTIK